MNQFKNKAHEEAFRALLMQSEGELCINKLEDEKKRRQIAFLYLIALYQEDYEYYEGSRFSVEVYEEISLDGPVYLLEECIQLEDFAHERMLKVAKNILRGNEPNLEKVDEADVKLAKIAYDFVLNKQD